MPGRLSLSPSAEAIGQSVFAELAPRIEARARAGGDLVPCHIGDTHLPPPEAARFACVEPEPDPSLYRYGAVTGLPALREGFAASLGAEGRGPPGVDPARHVLVGAGATHAIFCALRAVLEPGDEVLVRAPYWPLAPGIVRAAGGVPVEVPALDDVAGRMAAAIGPRTRALYLITPNNPDGDVLSRDEVERLARLAVERDLWVLADEVYADLVFDGEHVPLARAPGMAERTLSAYSLSKSHALAGARLGFVVAPERVVKVAGRVETHTAFHPSVASQKVGLAALTSGAAWLAGARDAYREARDETVRALARLPVRFRVPAGGSYVFVDFAPALGGRPLRALLEVAIDRGVLLAPGDGCGEAFGAWARLCFTAVPLPRLREGLERLKAAMSAFV